jgi:hypothetical protein
MTKGGEICCREWKRFAIRAADCTVKCSKRSIYLIILRISTFRIESDIMKRHFISLLCAITAIGGLFIAINPAIVSAENRAQKFVDQTEVSTLVTMAIPPYKW